jgi:succinoglycan biosynthesis protein ExoL
MASNIVFFGHDAADAAIRRRMRSFADDGCKAVGFMMRRNAPKPTEWTNIDLGQTQDGAFAQRIAMIFRGADRAVAEGEQALRAADVFYARNLDMLASAFLTKRKLKLKTPVIYECLDVHRLMVGKGPIARMLRFVERRLLKRCAGLVVSSPGFLKNYFDVHHKGLHDGYLVENRLVSGADYGPRPTRTPSATDGPLRLGWYGILRCSRSLDLLAALADKLGDRIEVHLHGKVATTEISDFDQVIAKRDNMLFAGAYKSPEDLARIYEGSDLVWAGDFMEAGYNSVWLLPNRIYEGGYYATPAIAPKGTQTGIWLETHGCGFTINEPLEETLAQLVQHLQEHREEIKQKQEVLLDLPSETFIQPHGEMGSIIAHVLQSRP